MCGWGWDDKFGRRDRVDKDCKCVGGGGRVSLVREFVTIRVGGRVRVGLACVSVF